MTIKTLIYKIYKLSIYLSDYRKNNNRYIRYLKMKGIRIGEGTYFHDPKNTIIDVSRPELLTIGKHVFIHRGTKIFTHDWASWCFIEKYNDFIPSHSKVSIGNNVWLGENVTILKGVTIGNNVIVGAGSIISKSIPSDSVAVGTPAKVISTIDDYYKNRKEKYREEVIEYCQILIKNGIEPTESMFYDDYPIFINKTNYTKYKYPYFNVFKKNQFDKWLNTHQSEFDSFKSFVDYCKNI